MKSKQLANVLIKILGLSLFAQSAMQIVTGLINVVIRRNMGAGSFLWSYFLSGAVLAAIGIFLIGKSREVAEYLFKGDEE